MGVAALVALLANPAVAEQSEAHFTVSVVVPTLVILNVLDQPSELSLSTDDVERGYKDVTARYVVNYNDPRGYLLRLVPRLGVTRYVEVRGLASEVVVYDQDVEIHQVAAERPQDLELQFRFVLDDSAQPGSYLLPVHVAATLL
jgi:hypothetical protein